MITYHKDNTLPTDGRIFVFGSNLIGLHGAGAAKAACAYGAVIGYGVGRVNGTYAIPTKDAKVETMPLDQIKPYIDTFIDYTKSNPTISFFVTRVGCGLAGYKDADIAPMFKGAVNCSFAESWKEYLEN